MTISIKRVTNTNTPVIPTRGTPASAGYDLHTTEYCDIAPGETKLIGTGIAMAIPDGYFGAIYPRSGISVKQGLRLANCVAVIDSDYRGELKIPLYNDSNNIQTIVPGDRIAQIIIQPYLQFEWEEVNELSKTNRDTGGFGSTGRN